MRRGSVRAVGIGRVRRNVVAYVALGLAVAGGTAWALTANSVRSKHIAPNAVRDSDLADAKSVLVKPNTAGTFEANPCTAGKSGVFCGYDDGGPTDGRWVNRGGGYARVAFRKDPAGTVFLSGSASLTSYQSTLQIFRLPRKFRPARTHVFTTSCHDGSYGDCEVVVAGNGDVSWSEGQFPRTALSLDGIAFPAR